MMEIILRSIEVVLFGEWGLTKSLALRGFYWEEDVPHITEHRRRFALRKRGNKEAIFFCEFGFWQDSEVKGDSAVLYTIIVPKPWHEALEMFDPLDEAKPEEFIIRVSLLRYVTVNEVALMLAWTFAQDLRLLRVKRV